MEGRRLAIFRFALEAAANAVGTIVAAGVIYLAVVTFGVVQDVNVGALLASLGLVFGGIAAGLALWRMANAVKGQMETVAAEAARWATIVRAFDKLPPDRQAQLWEELRRTDSSEDSDEDD